MDPLAHRVAARHLQASGESYARRLADAWDGFTTDLERELETAMYHVGYTGILPYRSGAAGAGWVFDGHPSGHNVSLVVAATKQGNIGATWEISGVPGSHHGALGSFNDAPAQIAAKFVKDLSMWPWLKVK